MSGQGSCRKCPAMRLNSGIGPLLSGPIEFVECHGQSLWLKKILSRRCSRQEPSKVPRQGCEKRVTFTCLIARELRYLHHIHPFSCPFSYTGRTHGGLIFFYASLDVRPVSMNANKSANRYQSVRTGSFRRHFSFCDSRSTSPALPARFFRVYGVVVCAALDEIGNIPRLVANQPADPDERK